MHPTIGIGDTITVRISGCSLASWHQRTGEVMLRDGNLCFHNHDIHPNIFPFQEEYPLLRDVIRMCKQGWPVKA